ncbi:MAG: GNAT family N-acetyltransferase [Chloroflexota bacterium]
MPPSISVRDLDASLDEAWAVDALGGLSGRWQARRGELVDVPSLPGLVAELDGERAGLLTYDEDEDETEIAALLAVVQRRGIATALVQELRRRVTGPIWLVTTNDNLVAQAFYARLGFRVREIRRGAVDESRRTLKPSIPLIGDSGLPIIDEVEMVLDPEPRRR